MTGYILRWFTRPQAVTHTSTNPAVHGRKSNSQVRCHNHYTTKLCDHWTI